MTPAPRAFKTPERFRAWLAKHHDKAAELVVRLFKAAAASRGMTYTQALDEALCFGWIDGVRRALDEESFTVRFSPRKPGSVWSTVNVRKVEALIQAGRMAAPGLAQFKAKRADRTGIYSFENRPKEFPPDLERRFRRQARAWSYFVAQPPWYRRTTTFYVVSAKREETRVRRLEILIDCCRREAWLPGLERKQPRPVQRAGRSRAAER